MVLSVKEITSQLIGEILNAVGENIVMSAARLWGAITANEWSRVPTFAFTLVISIVYGYRLVRNNALDPLEYLFSKS